jgi:hypothetical protein
LTEEDEPLSERKSRDCLRKMFCGRRMGEQGMEEDEPLSERKSRDGEIV